MLDKINDVLLRIVESGFIAKWLSDSKVNINKTIVPDYQCIEGHLDLDRIFGAFVLLGVGCLVSFSVFIAELADPVNFVSPTT